MGGFSTLLRANKVRVPALVSVIAVAGLVAVSAPLSGPADATGPTLTCTTGVPGTNVLGAATGWTEFIEGDGHRQSDSEGSVAYGGSLNAGGPTFVVGGQLAAGPGDTTLVVGGAHGPITLEHGSGYVSDGTGVNFNGGGHHLASNPIDFSAAFASLRDLSTSWAAAAPNGTVEAGSVSGGQPAFEIHGTNPELNVITLTPAQVAQLNGIGTGGNIYYNVPAGSTTIINVPGTAASSIGGHFWTGPSTQASDASMAFYNGIIWNFPDATSLSVNAGSDLIGHILAPNAAITVNAVGHMTGQVIAKSFTSNYETHLGYFPTQACVPGTPPETPHTSDVTITKSASALNPHGGETVTYTLTATNLGDADATGVVIRDELPAGVTFVSATAPCTQAGGVVTCAVGALAAGASASVDIVVTANPIAGAGVVTQSGDEHWMDFQHPESGSFRLEAGEQRSVTVSCNRPGDIVSDGNFVLKQVDQGMGTFSDLKVLSSQSVGTGIWKGVIRNDAQGSAQVNAVIVCLPGTTAGGNDGHAHHLLADSGLVTSTDSLLAGHTNVTLTCRPGTVPIVPGYDLSSASATLVGSEGDYDTRTWTLTYDVTSPVTVTSSVRCLSTTTTAYAGHTHQLRFEHVVSTVSVPGNTDDRGNVFRVTCADDAKGVVGTFHLPPGVKTWGNEPQIKSRDFWLFNQSGHAKDATIDLFCLKDRTGTRMGTLDPVSIVNTATVSSTSTDANHTNNSASATITVQPGSTTVAPTGHGLVAGSSFSMRVVSSMPGTGKVKVASGGKVLAKGTVKLKAGSTSKASVKLTKAGKKKLHKLSSVKVSIKPTRGKTVTRTVAIGR